MNLELIENKLKLAFSIVGEMKSCQNEKTKDVSSLKMNLIEIIEMLEIIETFNESDSDSDSDSDDYSDSDSDASFTKEESTYIKNESHREYLKRYSLKPQFPLHYFNADRDK
jgi:hypothetical protein